jgi:hypothetical protein
VVIQNRPFRLVNENGLTTARLPLKGLNLPFFTYAANFPVNMVIGLNIEKKIQDTQ